MEEPPPATILVSQAKYARPTRQRPKDAAKPLEKPILVSQTKTRAATCINTFFLYSFTQN